MLKVITIDFWNTLFDSSNGTQRNVLRLSTLKQEIKKYDIEISEESFNDAMKASWEWFNTIWLSEQRTPPTIKSVEFFWSYLNLPFDSDSILRVTRTFEDSLLVYPPKLMDGVERILERLQEKYQLGLISDTGFSPGVVLRQLLFETNILKYFSSLSFSDETQVSKPNPIAFNKILDDLNCTPEQALHIGDIEDTDIKGAKALGMKAIRFQGDKTIIINMNKSEDTIADAVAGSWLEVLQLIEALDK